MSLPPLTPRPCCGPSSATPTRLRSIRLLAAALFVAVPLGAAHSQSAVPPAPAAWPVDPVTGQTLVNGRPVVGRVFLLSKTDGLKAYTGIADFTAGEPRAPRAALSPRSIRPPAIEQTRRIRTGMVQATLWEMDTKPSAQERRYYRPVRAASPSPSQP